jgi:L-amino acid N-acyltransferase YncA
MRIRIAKKTDLESLTRIFNQAVLSGFSTAHTIALRPEERLDWMDKHEPGDYPIFVAEAGTEILGWISVSAYRPERMALRFTKEISYYVDEQFHRKGIGSKLIKHVIEEAEKLEIKTLIAIVLERNQASIALLEKLNFSRWGHLPNVADFNGVECGHLYFGRRIG